MTKGQACRIEVPDLAVTSVDLRDEAGDLRPRHRAAIRFGK